MVKKSNIEKENNITNTETNSDEEEKIVKPIKKVKTVKKNKSIAKVKKETKPKKEKKTKSEKIINEKEIKNNLNSLKNEVLLIKNEVVQNKKYNNEKEINKEKKNNNEKNNNKEKKYNNKKERIIKTNNLKPENHHKKHKTDFNKILYDCVENVDLNKLYENDEKNLKKNEKKYNSSFDDILDFRKKINESDINNIDTIMYHDENNDGMFGCAIAYHYLKEKMNNNRIHEKYFNSRKINLVAIKPGFISEHLYKDKNVLIIDVSISENIIKSIINLSKSFIIIDDHVKTFVDEKIFNGSVHSACAYVWKFFYPKKEIPKIIQFVDNSDRKLFSTHISDSNSHYFNTAIGIRITHNKSASFLIKKKDGRLFDELWEISTNTEPNFWIIIGYYYDQVTNNLKDQIAINAKSANFQGYKVGVLNFNAPALSKQVGRQIITNFKNRGEHIDFAVCWGYEYTNNFYRIQLIDDHHQTKINLPDIARKLGAIGQTSKGGGGAGNHVGNFYWPKNNEMDIWDLFKKTYI